MKRLIFICALFALMLSGCSGWTVEPLPYITSTPFPSSTPIILSPTPIILPLPLTATSEAMPATLTDTPTTPTGTDTQAAAQTMSITPTTALSMTLTSTITSTPSAAVNAEILGCNTAIDITHGMGEVTNAYITISNIGAVNLMDVCATLTARDEGRPHPDKTKCVASLPAGDQVSEKLTVDSTLGKASSVQVDVTMGSILLQRVAQNACTDFDLIPPRVHNLGTVTPIPTP
ncbi:MAG: hypothetical protein WCA79_00540 [Anaerolineales bacterium]